MSTASSGRYRECACGCGGRTSATSARFIMGHRPPRDPAERFWEKVDKGEASQCWPWRAYLYANGYAMFTPIHGGPKVMAHRYAYEALVQPIPDEMTIDHLCRNRACCNPAHMEVVTRGENSTRGGGLQVANQRRTEAAELACKNGHPRTPEHATREASSGSWRCRTCRNEKRRRGEWK